MKKKTPAPKWTAKPRPVEEAGRKWLRHFEHQGDAAIDRVYLARTARGGEARKESLLVSLGAVEVLMFVRAVERGEVDQAPAKSIAARLRRVLEGATWNEAFEAPWALDPGKVTRLVARDWQLFEAFETKLSEVRKRRPRATLEEVRALVAREQHVSDSTLRAAIASVSRIVAAKNSREKI